MDRGNPALEDLLRTLAPQVLGVLARRYGQFDACEDAVQEALLEASLQWTPDSLPDNPYRWLMTVARRRLVDQWRSESARRRREETFTLESSALQPAGATSAPGEATARNAVVQQVLYLIFNGGYAAGSGHSLHRSDLTGTPGKVPVGPYRLQAAIAALHDEASKVEETDWQLVLRPAFLSAATSPHGLRG